MAKGLLAFAAGSVSGDLLHVPQGPAPASKRASAESLPFAEDHVFVGAQEGASMWQPVERRGCVVSSYIFRDERSPGTSSTTR